MVWYIIWLTIVTLTKSSFSSQYVNYKVGDSAIIFSCPHGSRIKPSELSDRKYGCYDKDSEICDYSVDNANATICNNTKSELKKCTPSMVTDIHTVEVCQSLDKEMQKLGVNPYVVILNISRTKIDANRKIFKATQNNSLAIKIYEEYHQNIADSIDAINGPAILFDIHGHGHAMQWIELGYTLTSTELNEENYKAEDTSIFNLFQHSPKPDKDIKDFVYGSKSLSNFLKNEEEDILVVPSIKFKGPGNKKYFTGGYTTRTYAAYEDTSAIQIELPRSMRNFEQIDSTAKILAAAIAEFAKEHQIVKEEMPSSKSSSCFLSVFYITVPLLHLITVLFNQSI